MYETNAIIIRHIGNVYTIHTYVIYYNCFPPKCHISRRLSIRQTIKSTRDYLENFQFITFLKRKKMRSTNMAIPLLRHLSFNYDLRDIYCVIPIIQYRFML